MIHEETEKPHETPTGTFGIGARLSPGLSGERIRGAKRTSHRAPSDATRC